MMGLLASLVCQQLGEPLPKPPPVMGRPIDLRSNRQRALSFLQSIAFTTTKDMAAALGLTTTEMQNTICRLRREKLIAVVRKVGHENIWRGAA